MKTNSIIRIVAAVLLVASLGGCVVVPVGGPYHHCGYYRCR